MAPMIWISMQLDPHNIDNYLDAAYWFAGKSGLNNPKLAHQVLLDGQMNNPRSYRIQLERGLLFLKHGEVGRARHALQAGLVLWPGQKAPDNSAALLDKERLLTYQALLHEASDDVPAAIESWQQVLQIFPERSDVRKRLVDLVAGKPMPVKASLLWKAILKRSEDLRGQCHRSDDPHGDQDAHGH